MSSKTSGPGVLPGTLLLVVLAGMLLMIACTQTPAPQPAPQPQTPPPASKPAYTNGEVPIAECHAPKGHGSGGEFEVVKGCVTGPSAACTGAVTDFDVDAFLDDMNGPNGDKPVCLTYGGATEAATYHTNPAAHPGRKIQIVRYDSNGAHKWKDGDPFLAKPPYPAAGPAQKAVSAKLDHRVAPPPGSCFLFRTFILVKDPGQAPKCYDPHIYTSCDPDCSLIDNGGSQ